MTPGSIASSPVPQGSKLRAASLSVASNSGLIIIKVHNISCLYARLSGPKFSALLPPFHMSYFNKKSLRVALSKTGYTMRPATPSAARWSPRW